jgi:glycosyltransferase involved in cell wall biosynthesis
MNVAIISPEYPPLTNWGGIARFNENLAGLLNNMGHNVHIITFDGKGDKFYYERKNGCTFYYIPLKTNVKIFNIVYYKILFPIRFFLKKIIPRTLFAIDWNIYSSWYFWDIYKKEKIQIVHTHSYLCAGAFIALLYRKIRIIDHIHGPQLFQNLYEQKKIDTRLIAWLEILYLRHVSQYIITCSYRLENWINQLHPKRKKVITTIHNFIDPSDFRNNKTFNKNILTYWGRIEYRKGPDTLLSAFVTLAKKYPNLEVWFIGMDTYTFYFDHHWINFKSFIEKQNIPLQIKRRIYVLPQIDDMETKMYLLHTLRGFSVFPARYEPFAYVNLEAFALKNIVIGTKGTGFEELSSKINYPYIVKPNPDEIVNVFTALHRKSNYALKNESEKNYDKIIQEYSIVHAVHKMSLFYQQIEI